MLSQVSDDIIRNKGVSFIKLNVLFKGLSQKKDQFLR